MNNQKKDINKDVYQANQRREDNVASNFLGVGSQIRQQQEQEKKRLNDDKGKNKNGQMSNIQPETNKLLQVDNASQVHQGWSSKPLEIDQLSLSKDIIRFNGPLLYNMEEEDDQDIMKATLKIQKLWKAKYHTIKKIKSDQNNPENSHIEDSNNNEGQNKPSKAISNSSPISKSNKTKQPQNGFIDKEFTFKPEQQPIHLNSPPLLNNAQKKAVVSPNKVTKVISSNVNRQDASPSARSQIHSQPSIIEKKNEGYEQIYKSKIKQEKQQKGEESKEQLIQEQLIIKVEKKLIHKDDNRVLQQQQNLYSQQQQIQKEQQKADKDKSQLKEEKKINQQYAQLQRPNSERNLQRKEQNKKVEKQGDQVIVIANKNGQLEKRQIDKDVFVQQQQGNNNGQKKQQNSEISDKMVQKEQKNINLSPLQQVNNKQDIQPLIDMKKVLISQIIGKQIQQKNTEKKVEEKVVEKVNKLPQKPISQKQQQDLIQGKWELKDKEVLIKLVEVYGKNKWADISSHLPNKTPEECKIMYEKLISL